MRIFLIAMMVLFFSAHVQAADSNAPAPAPATSKVINEDDNPGIPEPTAKPSLTDLRNQQIENENEDAATKETTANPDADTDPDACTAKDISATMQMPVNLRESGSTPGGKPVIRGSGYTLNGSNTDEHTPSKMALCKAAYDKMGDACGKGMPCDGCEAALKKFTTACGYVGREESTDGSPDGSVGQGGGRTLDGRRNVPVDKLPQR